jgi:hypothetical protein
MKRVRHLPLFRAALLLALGAAGPARANPRPLAFTYPSETLPTGAIELEEFVDMTPVRAFDSSGALIWTPRAVLTTELEVGLTERLELGIYLQIDDDPGGSTADPALRFGGIKQRLRWRMAAPGEWPVDVTLYGEIAEMRNEVELEGKVILQRRFGRLRAMVNLWVEREFYYTGDQEWVLNPTAGITLELTPAWHVGLEGWLRTEFGGASITDPVGRFNRGPVAYAGPDLMWQRGNLWLTIAPYLRVDHLSRGGSRGDLYGRFFLRTIVGVGW